MFLSLVGLDRAGFTGGWLGGRKKASRLRWSAPAERQRLLPRSTEEPPYGLAACRTECSTAVQRNSADWRCRSKALSLLRGGLGRMSDFRISDRQTGYLLPPSVEGGFGRAMAISSRPAMRSNAPSGPRRAASLSDGAQAPIASASPITGAVTPLSSKTNSGARTRASTRNAVLFTPVIRPRSVARCRHLFSVRRFARGSSELTRQRQSDDRGRRLGGEGPRRRYRSWSPHSHVMSNFP